MVVLMRDGGDYLVEDERGEVLKKTLKGSLAGMMDIFGDGKTLVSKSAIAQVMDDAEFDEYDHKRKGDKLCRYGHWHAKGEGCAHGAEQKFSSTTPLLDAEPVDLETSKNFAILKRNREIYRATGKWGKEGVSPEANLKIATMKQKGEEWLNRPGGNRDKATKGKRG